MGADQLAELAKNGPAWVLLVAAIGGLVYLVKGRIADWKEISGMVKDFAATLRDWIAANEPRTRALEANVRALELLTVEIVSLKNAITTLHNTIEDRTGEALKSNRDMRESVLGLKEQVVAIYNRCTRGVS